LKHRICLVIIILLLGSAAASSATLQIEGEVSQSSLLRGHVAAGERVFLGKRELQTTPDGEFICGFGRDADPQQVLTLIDADGKKHRYTVTLQQRKYNIQRINGISSRMMNPSKEDLARIHHEAELVAAARQTDSRRLNFREKFIWPVTGRISGIYGSQRILNGEPRRPHFGVDIAAPKGTPVKAPAGGVVTLAHPGMFFSGKTLIIDHGYGLSSSFLHLSKLLVKEGDVVVQGQPIAEVGATGRVTGPHLDWRVNWFEQRLDAAKFVPPMPEN